jgi:heterogeneous nuclear ribonucleoprotein A1/A3
MGTKLFVGGLSWDTDEGSLRRAFQSAGDVVDVRIVTDRDTGRSRGFGFVSYATRDEAARAMETLDGSMLDGRSLRVSEANERPPRRSGGYQSY